MKRSCCLLVLAALQLAGPAQARTVDTFCTELRRIVRSTGETPFFASLERAPAQLPGFGDRCELLNDRHGRRFTCTMIAPDREHWRRLAAHTERCLSTALRRPDEPEIGLAQFRTGTAFIVIRQHILAAEGRGIDLSFTVHPVPVH